MGDHGVKESALPLVLYGTVRVATPDEGVDAGAGALFQFDPDERRAVTSDHGARLLLLLGALARRGALPRREVRR
jgi:hypothetical protein